MNLYTVCVGAGAALGLYALARSAKPKDANRSIDAGLILLVLALAGARIGYVLIHQEYYFTHLAEIPAFWLGGLSWVGCAAGLLAGVPLIRWMFDFSPAEAIRITVALAAPLAILTWLGCWTAGVGYGPSYPQASIFAWPAADETGQFLPRLPLPFICALLAAAALGLLEKLKSRRRQLFHHGTALAALILSADFLLFALLRADPVREVLSIRVDTAASVTLVLFSLAALLFLPEEGSGKTRPPVS